MKFGRSGSMLCSCAIALISITWLAAPTSRSFSRALVETRPNQRSVTLEIIDFCDGMCGRKGNKISLRVDDNRRAEYKVSITSHPLGKADETVISTIDLLLDEKEFGELMKLTETTDFLSADATYDSGVSLVDSVYLKFIIYRGANREKVVVIKNYSPADMATKRPLPGAIRRIIQIAAGLTERADKEIGPKR